MTLAYVDANVILRFLLDEPPEMAEHAAALFELAENGKIDLFIPEIVIAEAVWLLKSFYKYKPVDITRVLNEFIANAWAQMENKALIFRALDLFAGKNVDFTDALIAAHMIANGVEKINTFDSHFDRLPGIVRAAPGSV